jgi:hypothetical protein
MLRLMLFLCSLFAFAQTASAGVQRIADGDCSGLAAAISQASPAQPVKILLARSGNYSACSFSATGGNVDIDGQGSTFQFLTANIATSAAVTVRNATVTAAIDSAVPKLFCGDVLEGFGGAPIFIPAICNSGSLTLANVAINNLQVPAITGMGGAIMYWGFVYSAGSLILRNVSIAGSHDPRLITFAGSTEIYNSTFSNNSSSVLISTVYDALNDHASVPQLRIANSVITSTDSSACDLRGASATSFGGNVGPEASCGLSTSVGDKIDSSLSLPAAADHGGLVPTVQIGFGNPAYRAGVAQYCEATDARGVTRNAANCDAGAYESGGGLGLVTSNGMNGLYYVPGIANGHYVSVQRIHDNKDVLVFWNTFDRNGKQAWIFGVGTMTSDRHIHASMARTLGGVLQPGGPATGAKASDWGTVDIDLTNCSAAQFNYQSDLPEFGSGQFPLTRLAFESAVNCGD